jgi:hypothetical protein
MREWPRCAVVDPKDGRFFCHLPKGHAGPHKGQFQPRTEHSTWFGGVAVDGETETTDG